jgi:hypothetical protein
MFTDVPEKLWEIVEEIEANGQATLTRLTVLKKWFKQRPERLGPFALWVAARATSRKGKTTGEAAALFREARVLLKGLDKLRPKLDRPAAKRLHDRLRAFQNEYERQRWALVRIVRNRNLLVLEEALAIALGYANTPTDGYKLAAAYCRHDDSRYFEALNGPSQTKILEIVRFMFTTEALEDWPSDELKLPPKSKRSRSRKPNKRAR